MNVQITAYVNFSGPASGLEPLLRDITDAIIENGYGVDPETDALVSLLTVKESPIGSFENVNDFAKALVQDTISVIIPVNKPREVEDAERSGD